MYVIQTENLGKTFRGGRGVFDLNFEVESGEIFGFLGPNGAGKTTTIRLLMGLLRPTTGKANVLGRDCWLDSALVKSQVGFVPGEVHLYEKMTGEHLLRYLSGFRPRGAFERAQKLAAEFDVNLNQRVQHLSKGNRQKLVLVQALMHEPKLLVLDEPTSGLDPLMQAAFLDRLVLERKKGTTIFLSSHILSEVEEIADRVAIIREGRLVAVESIKRLQSLRERRMIISLSDPVADSRLAGIPGVRLLSREDGGRRMELSVRGQSGPLLQRIATLPVADIEYPPADLESVFLHYYEEESPKVVSA